MIPPTISQRLLADESPPGDVSPPAFKGIIGRDDSYAGILFSGECMDAYVIQHEVTPIFESRAVKSFIRAKYLTKQALSIWATYSALCELAGDNSKGFWPIKQIAKRAFLSYPTCANALKELRICMIVNIEPQRDEKGHVKPSKITLLTRESLNQDSLTRDSTEQKSTSKESVLSTPKESKDYVQGDSVQTSSEQQSVRTAESTQKPKINGGMLIASFVKFRNASPKHAGQKYTVSDQDASTVKRFLKLNPDLTLEDWERSMPAFFDRGAEWTYNHGLRAYCGAFESCKPTAKPKRSLVL